LSEAEKQAATKRWQAVEGFNLHPNLSCVARRLGILLVSLNNSTTTPSYQSQAYLARLLNCNERSIRRALTELTVEDLIEYEIIGRKCHYQVKFWAMQDIVDAAKLTAKRFMEQGNSGPTGPVSNTGQKCPVSDEKTPTPDISVLDTGHSRPVTPDLHARLSYLKHLPQENLPQGAASAAVALEGASSSAFTMPADHKASKTDHRNSYCTAEPDRIAKGRAMNERGQRQRPRFYPKLFQAFEGTPEIFQILERLSMDVQHEASKRLAMEGPEAAAAYVREYTS
jgi:hypothetical protein